MSRLSVHIIIYVFNTLYSLLLFIHVDKIQMKCTCFPLFDADFGAINVKEMQNNKLG